MNVLESFSWRVAGYPWDEMLARVAADSQGPAHFVLLKLWMAVAGDSLASLRGLSVVCSLLAAAAVFAAVRAAAASTGRRGWFAPAVAALVFAASAAQLEAAFTARCYALGVLGAALSAWTLLVAMRCGRRAMLWWTAWGASAALLCYTHYFGFFAVAGQTLFIVGYTLIRLGGWGRVGAWGRVPVRRDEAPSDKAAERPPGPVAPLAAPAASERGTVPFCSADSAKPGQSPAAPAASERGTVPFCSADSAKPGQSPAAPAAPERGTVPFCSADSAKPGQSPAARDPGAAGIPSNLARGFAYGALLALALYSPWLPVFLQQARMVQTGFGLEAPPAQELYGLFCTWSSGVEFLRPGWDKLWMLLLAALVAHSLLRCGPAGWCLLLQAAAPWAGALAVTFWLDRPLILPRYLVLGHVALVSLWGVNLARLPGWPVRAALAALVLGTAALGGWVQVERLLAQQPPAALTLVAEHLRQHYRTGDVVVVGTSEYVNLMRYYAGRAGLRTIDVRCPVGLPRRPGWLGQDTSLEHGEVLPPDGTPPAGVQRVWRAGDTGVGPPPPGFARSRKEVLSDGRSAIALSLYERVR